MRKQLLLASVAVIVAACMAFVNKPVTSCARSVTFYNNSTTYTVPAVSFSDGSALPGSDVTHYNIAPSSTDVLNITYNSGSLEFNVQFSSPHPAGRVRLIKNSVIISSQCFARNSNVVTLQFDNSPDCNQSDVYELVFDPNATCP